MSELDDMEEVGGYERFITEMSGVIALGKPQSYPENRPSKNGYYLVWYCTLGIVPSGWEVRKYHGSEYGFPFDSCVTYWLPIPPSPEQSCPETI